MSWQNEVKTALENNQYDIVSLNRKGTLRN